MKTLNAFVDLDVTPVSYDFVVFLIKAELERRRINAEKLHVVIVPGTGPGGFRDKSQFYDAQEAKFRLWNICIPACALIGASVTLAVDWEQAERIACLCVEGKGSHDPVWPVDWNNQTLRTRPHLVGDIVKAAHAGNPIPLLRASEHARRTVRKLWSDKQVVTLTLRSTYLGDRNTSPMEWCKASDHITSLGFTVRFVYDVSEALKHGDGFAELNLDLRMAMYQEASLNLIANCGPSSLCWFSEKPYRMFDAGVGTTEAEWRGLFCEQGLPWGATWPWAKAQQKIVYERSTADVIIREFESWDSETK